MATARTTLLQRRDVRARMASCFPFTPTPSIIAESSKKPYWPRQSGANTPAGYARLSLIERRSSRRRPLPGSRQRPSHHARPEQPVETIEAPRSLRAHREAARAAVLLVNLGTA